MAHTSDNNHSPGNTGNEQPELARDLDALPATSVLAGHPYAEFLGRVAKPGRYLGGEEQQTCKPLSQELACRFVLAFPDLYEVGMSHLGTKIIYKLLNSHPDLACERAFSPWIDVEAELRARSLPLVSLENALPLHAFDVVGVSLQYELCYTNVLLNLELGGVPLRSADRGDEHPIVIAGGPTATHPEPLAAFVDLFLVGEAEEVLPDLLRLIGRMRRGQRSRAEILASCAQVPGIYVPAFYRVAKDPRSELLVVVGRTPEGVAANAPETIERVWVRDLDQFPFPTDFPVPYAEAIFDRASVEITRGCTEGCRFCQAGIIYRPVRERSPEAVVKAVLDGVDNAGFSETSLTALSTADVSCINPLIKALTPELRRRKVKLGVASLRAYGLDESLLDDIKTVGITGLTFAPEAGTQRMRNVINKNVSDDDILTSARRIFERGYDRIKMYFIMGLPTETEADVVGIIETGRRVRDVARELNLPRMPTVTCSVSQHVPKPHTPFQWAAMDNLEDLRSKVNLLRDKARQAKVSLKTHNQQESWLECLFARGDRRMGEALELAYRAGSRFEGWRECFSFERWLNALEGAGIEPDLYTRTIPVDARLPWDHIDIGLEPGFLADEYRKALKSRHSPPCGKPFGAKVHHTNRPEANEDSRRLVCYDCGIACDMSEMRSERIDSLRTLENLQMQPLEPAFPPQPTADIVPLSRLKGRLSPSKLPADHMYRENAEAPYSRARLLFAKQGTMCFMGHLDLIRVIPRMLRRAHIEMGFTRGFNPTPRMSFGPALPLGMAALEEVVDLAILLPDSTSDMAGVWTDEVRAHRGQQVLEKLRAVAPPGLVLVGLRLLSPGERKAGALVDAADYVVALGPEQVSRLEQTLPDHMGSEALIVERPRKQKKGKRLRKHAHANTPQIVQVDIRPLLLSATVDRDASLLRFRLRMGNQGGARPREVVKALVGESVADHRFCRERLLSHQSEAYVALGQLGPIFTGDSAAQSRS